MDFLKKIIREELQRVINTLNEDDFYTNVDYDNVSNKESAKDSIIYNYERGRAFAGDSIEGDIINLNRYKLVEYLPHSITSESWSFEFYTVYGTTLMVDIKRTIKGGKSFWSLKFGQLYKGEQVPTLISELESIEGYDKFVDAANNKISKEIDPSNY